MISFANAYRKILADVEQGQTGEVDTGVLRLARALAGKEKHSLHCQVCNVSLPVFIDDEISGVDVARKYPNVKHHLDVCPRCATTYVQLLQLAWLIDTGQLTIAGFEPPLEQDFLPELREMFCND